MAELPPPSAPAGDRRVVTSELAARVERLAERRRPTPHGDADADRAARLERLSQRSRAATDPATGRGRRRRRNHPAKGARVAALGMSLATTAGLAGFFATLGRPAAAESPAVIVSGGPSAGIASAPDPSSSGIQGSTVGSSSPTVVDGAVFRNKWGTVQVEATFSPDGTLAHVAALQTPDGRSRSVSINDFAVPRLNSEALQAQSASVHTVSGATYTSDGYRRSLQSAIDAARSAGVTEIA